MSTKLCGLCVVLRVFRCTARLKRAAAILLPRFYKSPYCGIFHHAAEDDEPIYRILPTPNLYVSVFPCGRQGVPERDLETHTKLTLSCPKSWSQILKSIFSTNIQDGQTVGLWSFVATGSKGGVCGEESLCARVEVRKSLCVCCKMCCKVCCSCVFRISNMTHFEVPFRWQSKKQKIFLSSCFTCS